MYQEASFLGVERKYNLKNENIHFVENFVIHERDVRKELCLNRCQVSKAFILTKNSSHPLVSEVFKVNSVSLVGKNV